MLAFTGDFSRDARQGGIPLWVVGVGDDAEVGSECGGVLVGLRSLKRMVVVGFWVFLPETGQFLTDHSKDRTSHANIK